MMNLWIHRSSTTVNKCIVCILQFQMGRPRFQWWRIVYHCQSTRHSSIVSLLCRVNLNLIYPVPFLLLKLLIDWFAPRPISDVIEYCLFIFSIGPAVHMYERQTSDSFKPANINSISIARHQTSDSPESAIKSVEQIFSSSATAQRRIFLHRTNRNWPQRENNFLWNA